MNFMTDSDESGVNDATRDLSKIRIGHVNLRVADLNRATDFYCNVLGMTVTCYGPTIGVPTVFLAFGDYHHHLALTWFYDDKNKSQNVGALNHFAIVYPDELSLAKAMSKVLERGDLIDDVEAIVRARRGDVGHVGEGKVVCFFEIAVTGEQQR